MFGFNSKQKEIEKKIAWQKEVEKDAQEFRERFAKIKKDKIEWEKQQSISPECVGGCDDEHIRFDNSGNTPLKKDPYKKIREIEEYYRISQHGENLCIVTKNYLIDSWLMLARMVYYDPEKAKAYKKEINYLNSMCDKVIREQLNLIGSHCINEFKDHDTFCVKWSNFKFKPLIKEDTQYLEELDIYCNQQNNVSLQKFDSTYGIETCINFILDFMINNIDYNFETYEVSEKELNEIIKLRKGDTKITTNQFLSFNKYKQHLLLKQAYATGTNFIAYNTGLNINKVKLEKDLTNNLYQYIKKKERLSKFEIDKDVWGVEINSGIDSVIDSTLYPAYIQDNEGHIFNTGAYFLRAGHANAHYNQFENKFVRNPIVTLKEINGALLAGECIYNVYNPCRYTGVDRDGFYDHPTVLNEECVKESKVFSQKEGRVIDVVERGRFLNDGSACYRVTVKDICCYIKDTLSIEQFLTYDDVYRELALLKNDVRKSNDYMQRD